MFPYPCPPHFPKYTADFPKEERTLKTVPVTKEQFPVFHRLLTDYYRDGEDAQTPQEELDGFIEMLFELCTEGAVSGCIAYEKDALGFVIYGLDTKDFPFSNKPGCGTILEIGVVPSARGSGLGRILAKYAEEAMDCEKYYVCAYGPAESFWKKCSYRDTGEIASNGLKIFEKMRTVEYFKREVLCKEEQEEKAPKKQ